MKTTKYRKSFGGTTVTTVIGVQSQTPHGLIWAGVRLNPGETEAAARHRAAVALGNCIRSLLPQPPERVTRIDVTTPSGCTARLYTERQPKPEAS